MTNQCVICHARRLTRGKTIRYVSSFLQIVHDRKKNIYVYVCVFRSLQFLELNTLALRVEKTSETASLTARDPLIWPRPGRGNEAEYRAIDQRYVERKRRIRIKSERRLTLTGARKSGAVTACGLT